MPNPNSLDWVHCQDIQTQDVSLKNSFVQLFESGQYSDALELLDNNQEQLKGKAFVSNLINLISSGILDLEQRYNNSVPVFLSNLSSEYFILIDNFIKKGTWNAAVQYQKFNFVVYNSEIYMCLQQPPIGTLPTDTGYWMYFGLLGIQGAPGVDVSVKYAWNVSNTYFTNDIVTYNSNIYVAKKESTGIAPGTDESAWQIFIALTPGQIYVSPTEPEKKIQNSVWFKTDTNPTAQITTDPIAGMFYRYNTTINDWEEMYPDILFRMLNGFDAYTPSLITINIEIKTNQWQNNQFIYNYPTLNENSLVTIAPGTNINSSQYNDFSYLTLSIEDKNIILTAASTPINNIPIIINIQ